MLIDVKKSAKKCIAKARKSSGLKSSQYKDCMIDRLGFIRPSSLKF